MAELIEGADIVDALVNHLATEIPARGGGTIPVASRRRAGDAGVVVFDTGGPGFANHITDRAQVTIDVRQPTEGAAWRTASLIRAIVLAAPGTTIGGAFIQRAGEFARPALLPDPEFDGARYRWSTIIHTRAHVR